MSCYEFSRHFSRYFKIKKIFITSIFRDLGLSAKSTVCNFHGYHGFSVKGNKVNLLFSMNLWRQTGINKNAVGLTLSGIFWESPRGDATGYKLGWFSFPALGLCVDIVYGTCVCLEIENVTFLDLAYFAYWVVANAT